MDNAAIPSATTNSYISKHNHGNKQRDKRSRSLVLVRSSDFKKRRKSFGKATRNPPVAKAPNIRLLSRQSSRAVINSDSLIRPGVGTRSRISEGPDQAKARLARMCAAVRTLIECVGEDPDREGLQATPLRYAKALLFFTKGYQINLNEVVNNALFREQHGGIVIVKDVEIHSLCEHHLVPFVGKVQVVETTLCSLD